MVTRACALAMTAVVASLETACALNGAVKDRCNTMSDCNAGNVCIAGVCSAPPGPVDGGGASSDARGGAPDAASAADTGSERESGTEGGATEGGVDCASLTGWTVQATPAQTPDLTSVWGSGRGDVYAVGKQGIILHSLGDGRWTAQTNTTEDLSSVWGSSPTDVYVAGAGGIFHSTGTGSWNAQWTQYSVTAVFGSGPAAVYAAQDETVLFSAGDGTWTTSSGPSGNRINSLWAGNPTAVYAVGFSSEQPYVGYSTGGAAWATQSVPMTELGPDLWAIWGSGVSDIYAVGDGGNIVHSKGDGTWTTETLSLTPSLSIDALHGVWGSGPDDVYAIGAYTVLAPSQGFIAHSTGGAWQAEAAGSPPTGSVLRGIWGSGCDDVYVVGSGGTILHHP